MVTDTTTFVAQQANKTADAISQLGRKGVDFNTLPAFNKNIVEVGKHRIKESQQNIAGNILIYGNEDFGIWGSFYWGGGAETSFILGHSIAGILGTSKLGSNVSDFIITAVYNDNNWFPEYFDNDRFIDETISTGSWDSGSDNYILADNEVFITELIAKENKIYKALNININSIDSVGSDSNDYLKVYASNNAGSDWQLIEDLSILNSLSDGDVEGLKIKIENYGFGEDLTMPLTMPLSFQSKKIVKIEDFNVKYSV